MRAIKFVTLAMALCAGSARAQNTCHTADSHSDHFINALTKLMAAEQASFRTTLQLPQVAPSQIVLASDSLTCAQAGAAVDSMLVIWEPAQSPTPSSAAIYVIRIGTSYAVADLNSPPGDGPDPLFIFGPLWEYRGIIGL